MNLQHSPFNAIKEGRKDIEMRLYDERRKNIAIGDVINFTNLENGEKMSVRVINLYRFNNFEELYDSFDKSRLGYLPNQEARPTDMEIYYPIEKIVRCGVLAIEIELIK